MLHRVRALVPAIAAFAVLAVPAQAGEQLSKAEFRDTLMDVMQANSADYLCLRTLEDGGFRTGLSAQSCDYFNYVDLVYDAYQANPDQLQSILDEEAARLLSIMTAGVDQSDFDQRLVIQMRGADFVATATKPGEPPIAARAFTEDLQAVLMLDSAETLSTVSVETLKAQGLSEDEAFQIAIGNTRDRMGAVSSQSYDNMTVLSSENGLISGELSLPETCSASSEDAYYFIYDYNGVLKADSDNLVGVSKLLSIARGMSKDDASVTSSVVRCQSGEWDQFWPRRRESAALSSSVMPG